VSCKPNENIKIVAPLEGFNFNYSSWILKISIAESDFFNLDKLKLKQKNLCVTNREDLKKIQKLWVFKETGLDVATISSTCELYKDSKSVMLEALNIEIEGPGLQTSNKGYIIPLDRENFLKSLQLFKPCCAQKK